MHPLIRRINGRGDETAWTDAADGNTASAAVVDQLTLTDPDRVMLYPTTAWVQAHDITALAATVNEAVTCPVGGVSMGGFATSDTDGFQMLGVLAVAINDLSFTTERVENVWEADTDRLEQLLSGHDETVRLPAVFQKV